MCVLVCVCDVVCFSLRTAPSKPSYSYVFPLSVTKQTYKYSFVSSATINFLGVAYTYTPARFSGMFSEFL